MTVKRYKQFTTMDLWERDEITRMTIIYYGRWVIKGTA